MRSLLLAAAVVLGAAGCSSSGSSAAPPPASTTTAIGQVVAPSTSAAPVVTADLGKPITQGALTITVSGPVTTAPDDPGLTATFHVTMANTGSSGDVVGPDFLGVRCNANRDDRNPGDMMSSSTIKGDAHIPAGKIVTGVVVDAWLTWDSKATCTGVTTVEARFLQGGSLSWTLPADVVAQVNAAAK